jgi:catechol 2,3-dioxygenase-like lactoylglutathione lyase family enzyme
MGFHHLALVTRDAQATYTFYSRAMGFELVKTVVAATPAGGWAKHFFFDTGRGELMAFWELHDESIPEGYSAAISTGMGLPEWVNHVAFAAEDLGDLDRRRERLVTHGYDVLEIDHGWCKSIYTRDPGGTLVEFCTTTREFDAEDRRQALADLENASPALEPAGPKPKIHEASVEPIHLRAARGEA